MRNLVYISVKPTIERVSWSLTELLPLELLDSRLACLTRAVEMRNQKKEEDIMKWGTCDLWSPGGKSSNKTVV